MAAEYSVETCRALEEAFRAAEVVRPMRVGRYEAGAALRYEVTGVAPARRATVDLRVERFVGGGFAGQVYRAEAIAIEGEALEGIEIGGHYALKVLLPPAAWKRRFRDVLFRIAFQGPFSPQAHPAAARAGALWQKLIRRGARVRLGSERAVVDVLGTFFDETLGSFGEINEWIDGRTWRFEVDDRLDARKQWLRGGDVSPGSLGSPEYRAKRLFMAKLVELFREMGAHELARQYEWWTAKSQPNVLKRLESEGDVDAGLTAVDFRAGLALLPFLPMSPADVKLIFKGIARGRWVQFDRGDLGKLNGFADAHPEQFADLQDALAELGEAEDAYRESLPDVTHHHVRLLYSGRLWSAILDGMVTSWRARGLADAPTAERLRASRSRTVLFAFLGILPLMSFAGGAALLLGAWAAGQLSWAWAALAAGVGIALPIAFRVMRRLWGRSDYRRHVWGQLTSPGYLLRARRARAAERLIDWHRAGAVSAERARRLMKSLPRYLAHAVFLGWMPAGLHRVLSDRRYAWSRVKYLVTRPVRLYFNPQAREQWLREMVAEGRANGMLTDEEAEHINSRIQEPFIQKYLKALAVHVCTLPVTQIVSLTVAVVYVLQHPELSWGDATYHAGLILGAFQITPISPGSIVRGLYVVYLVVRDRSFRDYNTAVFLGFFKYVGYLAFPVQMAYRYPALSRFMAGRWAMGAAHIVPVFGERGALLEHGMFDAFYNHLLTWRRRFREKDRLRLGRRPRRWHLLPCAIAGLAAMGLIDALCIRAYGQAPTLPEVWWLAIWPALLAGAASAVFAGGAPVGRRILLGAAVGAATGLAYGILNTFLAVFAYPRPDAPQGLLSILWAFVAAGLWRVLLFTIVAALGAFTAEAKLPVRRPTRAS